MFLCYWECENVWAHATALTLWHKPILTVVSSLMISHVLKPFIFISTLHFSFQLSNFCFLLQRQARAALCRTWGIVILCVNWNSSHSTTFHNVIHYRIYRHPEIKGFFCRTKVFIHEFSRCCCSSSSGGVMLMHGDDASPPPPPIT